MAATFFNDGKQPATDGANSAATNATVVPPGSMLNNDYVVCWVSAKTTAITITNPTTGGQAWTAQTDAEGSALSCRLFHCRFNGTWSANPNFAWTTSTCFDVWLLAFRGIDTVTAVDAVQASPVAFAAPGSPFDVTIAAATVTTTQANSMVIGMWTSADDNSWTLQTGGWTNPNGQAQWRNVGSTDQSMAIAYQVQGAAGGSGAVTNRQTALGGDAGMTNMIALRAAATVGPPAGRRTLALTGCGLVLPMLVGATHVSSVHGVRRWDGRRRIARRFDGASMGVGL